MQFITSLAFATVSVLAAFVAADQIPDFVVPGNCPVVDESKLWYEQKPRHAQFGGIWYQHSLTPNPYQPLQQCVQLEYTFDGQGFDAKGTGIDANGALSQTRGWIYPMPLGDPHLMVAFENTFPAPLVILDTDYNNYACLYSCIEHNNNYYSDFAFVFSRKPVLNDSYQKQCEAVFRKINVDLYRFSKTHQGYDCPYSN